MIVVGIDFSAASRAALGWALAERQARDDSLLVLHAGPPTSDLVTHTPVVEERHENAAERLAASVAELGGGGDRVAYAVEDGHAAKVLAERSREADLLVVGRTGFGAIESALIGSVSHEVVRKAACPVAVIPSTAPRTVSRVVVGVDGSADGETAAGWAAQEAARQGVPLVVAHSNVTSSLFEDAGDDEKAQALVDATAEAVRRDGLDVTTYVTREGAGRGLVGYVGADDLLVVGTHGRGAAMRLLIGSTSAYCVEHATGAVVVVPHSR